MRRRRGIALPVLLASLLGCVACGDPPEKEMQQAQGALDAARAAGADEYAHGEFAAAQEALQHAHDAVGERDYRRALNYALDSRERAQTAAKEGADRKAVARVEADRALTAVAAALGSAHERLKAAETARTRARDLSEPRAVIADGDRTLQKARAAFGEGHYLLVTETLRDATPRLDAAAKTLETETPAATPPRRRRR